MSRHINLRALAALAVFFGRAVATPSIAIAYCASSNTGTSSTNSIYMSEGSCHDTCNGDGYALAVLQDQTCWCSNEVPNPDDQVDTSEWFVSYLAPTL